MQDIIMIWIIWLNAQGFQLTKSSNVDSQSAVFTYYTIVPRKFKVLQLRASLKSIFQGFIGFLYFINIIGFEDIHFGA